jgi:hypothetical protein
VITISNFLRSESRAELAQALPSDDRKGASANFKGESRAELAQALPSDDRKGCEAERSSENVQ